MCDTRSFPKHYVYKYVDRNTKDPIYVGKSNASLSARIRCHRTDPRFAPYLGDAEVLFSEFPSSEDADAVEMSLIKELSPVLNSQFVEGLVRDSVSDSKIDWEPYENFERASKANPKREAVLRKVALLNEAFLAAALEAREAEKDGFEFPSASPGSFATLKGLPSVALREVAKAPDGYFFNLNPEWAPQRDTWRRLNHVWLPVAQVHSFSKKEEGEFDDLSRLSDFSYRLERLSKGNLGKKRAEITVGKEAWIVVGAWEPVFSSIEWKTAGECTVAVDFEKEGALREEILERIAKKTVEFFQRTGVKTTPPWGATEGFS